MFIKLPAMGFVAIVLIYIAFFALIGAAIYFTKEAHCLWALLLIPSFESCDCTDEESEDEEKGYDGIGID